jgi:type II secretory pathway pseudopilin PulG
MRTLIAATLALSAWVPAAPQVDYAALWAKATPFHVFLENARARQEQWRSRFANAAIDAAALNDARALPADRKILAIAEDRCSDSAWAVPYLAKLAAAVPNKIELRVIGRREGRQIQSEHLTPDGRRATPTIVILDENDRFIDAWVERPAELQKWYIDNKPTMSSGDLHEHMDKWYADDAGRSTINEVLAIMRRTAPEAK